MGRIVTKQVSFILKFLSLGSGSEGNATIIEAGGTSILLDCGFSCRETTRRLRQVGLDPEQLDAIVVTHEHNDHVSGIGVMSRKYHLPVWMNQGTCYARDFGQLHVVNIFHSLTAFQIGDIHCQPVIVPHDAREAVQFVFSYQRKRLGILTDLGHVTPLIQRYFSALDALVIEANHDRDMLWQGSYSPALKKRVAGDYGHLSNLQAAQWVRTLDYQRFQHLIAAHLSRQNNTPEATEQLFAREIPQLPRCFEVACQQSGFAWKQIN